MKNDELPLDYIDTVIDTGTFLEGLSVLLWSLEAFMRDENQNDVAESLRFLAFGCRDKGNEIAKLEDERKKNEK